MATACRVNNHSLLLVVGTALGTWLISAWLSFVRYSPDTLVGPTTGGVFCSDSHTRSSQSTASRLQTRDGNEKAENSHPRPSSSSTTKRKVWANLSRIDDPQSTMTIPSRVYPKFDHPFPCFPGEKQLQLVKPAHRGILFHRPTKTGTTTTTGIVMRLAHTRHDQIPLEERRQLGFTDNAPRCLHRSNHGSAIELEYGKRDKTKSFLFSLIRDPTARAISQFFHFEVTVGQVEPTDYEFIRYLKKPFMSNAYLSDLVMDPDLKPPLQVVLQRLNKTHDAVIQYPYEGDYSSVVQSILDSVDLIMVSERLDESLVVLKLLLGLTFDEIMYLRPARSAGSFSNGPPEERPCIYLIPSFITPTVDKFLQTDPEWYRHKEGDELLYLAAVKSLDRTIERLGRKKVQEEVEKFHELQRYAQAQCSGPKDVVSMCSEGGKRHSPKETTCYIWGEGCDHKCLNNLTKMYHGSNTIDT
mmetsp:Transcript_61114/g.149621  ORF Transcript_61114/g.149621 Transcript_61114/m.149621 type:complete len:470 (+) Transcript_61114:138-1547(+)